MGYSISPSLEGRFNHDGSKTYHETFVFKLGGVDLCSMFNRDFSQEEAHEILTAFFDYITDYYNVRRFISESYL